MPCSNIMALDIGVLKFCYKKVLLSQVNLTDTIVTRVGALDIKNDNVPYTADPRDIGSDVTNDDVIKSSGGVIMPSSSSDGVKLSSDVIKPASDITAAVPANGNAEVVN